MKIINLFQRSGKINNQSFYLINFILLFILLFSVGTNQMFLNQINKSFGIKGGFSSVVSKLGRIAGQPNSSLSGNIVEDVIKLVVSQGIPEVYGAELGISYDQVQQSINVLRQYDPTYGKQGIVLEGDNLKRYIDVGLKISCEYCCSAKSIINQNGQGACGCAHSQAMRGLMAYIIQNHGSEYSNDEILRELARWKGLYFPKQMISKLSDQLQGTQDFTPDTASLILDIKLPNYGSGQEAPLPNEIKDLPSMVGGC